MPARVVPACVRAPCVLVPVQELAAGTREMAGTAAAGAAEEATSKTRRARPWDWLPCEWMSPFTKEATSKTRPHYDSLLPAALPDPSSSPCPPLLAWRPGGVSMALAAVLFTLHPKLSKLPDLQKQQKSS